MVAEKTHRQNGRKPLDKLKRAFLTSTLGQELARQGQRLRWDHERKRAVIVDR